MSDAGCMCVVEEKQSLKYMEPEGSLWKSIVGMCNTNFFGFSYVCGICYSKYFLVCVTSLVLNKHSLLPNFEFVILYYFN